MNLGVFRIKSNGFLILFFVINTIFGQTKDTLHQPSNDLKFFINDKKTHWLALHAYGQFWLRYNENNPGSLVSEELQNETFDISIRRFRLGLQTQITDELFVYTQFGINNLNYLSPRGTALDLLDVYAEYQISKSFEIGGGKTAWSGLSRYSAPNTSKLLSPDLLLLALPTTDETDDLIRKLSVYVKGKLGKLDYRYVVSKPFSASNSTDFDGELVEHMAKFNGQTSNAIHSAYLKWEFWGTESNHIPFSDGTYLGRKKVLSIGIGAEYLNDGLSSLQNGAEKTHDMKLFAVDAFLDLPISHLENTVLTAYLGFFNYDFGPNYLRNTGVNNPILEVDTSLSSLNGAGNGYPVVGSGNSLFFQTGYLLPKFRRKKSLGQFQPYISIQYSSFEQLDDPMLYFDIGLNWLLKGHLSKFSLNFQNRPIFAESNQNIERITRKSTIILQYLIRLE